MNRTGAQIQQHSVNKDKGSADFVPGNSYELVVFSSKFVVGFQHDTGETDPDTGDPIYKTVDEKVITTKDGLETLCANAATVLSGTNFTGQNLEAIFKTAFADSAYPLS